ncbi:glutaredoxin-related protein [Trichinella spiralis]|uniref:glutaredoxin-related protein n=1 Tax=Trichinella spiralis TaxID=6334 RepID=UPI0001EFB46B|nr:glutaredoxin-related protein [Trichinella spiralis]
MYIISKQLDDNKQTDTLQALLGSPSPQFAWKLSSAVVVQLCSFAFTFPSILINSPLGCIIPTWPIRMVNPEGE